MGLEFQLNRMCKEKASLKEILKMVKKGMDQVKEQGEALPPVSFATISAEGYQSENP